MLLAAGLDRRTELTLRRGRLRKSVRRESATDLIENAGLPPQHIAPSVLSNWHIERLRAWFQRTKARSVRMRDAELVKPDFVFQSKPSLTRRDRVLPHRESQSATVDRVAGYSTLSDSPHHALRMKPDHSINAGQTAYIEPGSLWENGYVESFNARLRDELLNGEIFYSLREAQIIIENWRRHYNTGRPHNALGYRSPAPATIIPMDQRPVMH